MPSLKRQVLRNLPLNDPSRRFEVLPKVTSQLAVAHYGNVVPADPDLMAPNATRSSQQMAILLHTRGVPGVGCPRFEPGSNLLRPFADCVVRSPAMFTTTAAGTQNAIFTQCSSCVFMNSNTPVCLAIATTPPPPPAAPQGPPPPPAAPQGPPPPPAAPQGPPLGRAH